MAAPALGVFVARRSGGADRLCPSDGYSEVVPDGLRTTVGAGLADVRGMSNIDKDGQSAVLHLKYQEECP